MSQLMFENINFMKDAIEDENIKNLYSKFDFYFFTTSSGDQKNDEKKIRKMLRNPLKEFHFFVYNYQDGFLGIRKYSDNQNPENQFNENFKSIKINDKFKCAQVSNIVICGEGKFYIYEKININMIQKILKKSNSIQVNINNSTEISDQKLQNIELNTEIYSFKRFFSKIGQIFSNKFIEYTFSSIVGYLIRRFYYPTNYFKDPSFFNFFPDFKSDDQKFREIFQKFLTSQNYEDFNYLNSDLVFENNESNIAKYTDFHEKDLIELREIHSKESAKYYLVFHLKSLHIFLLKKFSGKKTKYQMREIKFCQNFSNHRCFVPFYGFLKTNGEIKGLLYEFMSNDTIYSFILQKENKDNQMFSYFTMTRVIEGLRYLHSNSLIFRDLQSFNILVDHDNIPYISDIEMVKAIDNLDENSNDNSDENSKKQVSADVCSLISTSPELFLGENASYESDIYQFGLLVYFLFEHSEIQSFYIKKKLINHELPNSTKYSMNINLLYKSCIKKAKDERIKIQGIYKLISNDITTLTDIKTFMAKIDITERSTEISQYLYENICILKENQDDINLKEYFYKFYFTALTESSISNEFMSTTLNNLGNLYFYGFGVTQDYKEAKKLYELAIHHCNENSQAHNNLGELYRFGKGVKRNFEIAKEHFELSSELQNSEALKNLGYLYYNGYGTKEDPEKAFKLIQKSADLNNANGLRNLGFLYEDGKAVEFKDFEKAIKCYENSIKLKNYYGYINLGLLYLKGDGVKKDYNIALFYFEKAKEKNIPGGFYNLGKMYLFGQGVPQNFKVAKKYLKTAKSYDNMDAIYYLGYLYYLQAKTTPNNEKLYQKARTNFLLSAQQGSYESLLKLGLLFEKGFGVEKDYIKAHCYYDLAVQNSSYSAVYKLATEYSNGEIFEINLKSSIQYYKKCIETDGERIRIEKDGFYNIRYNKHYHPANNDLGLLYLLNNDIYDFNLAISYIRNAANSEYQYAQNNFGLLCELFLHQNYKTVKEWYEKSAKTNFALAFFNLAHLIEENEKNNLKGAIKYYKKAIEHENDEIRYHNHKIKDKRLEISKSYILIFAKFKVILYYLANNKLKKFKKYLNDVYGKFNENDEENIFLYIRDLLFVDLPIEPEDNINFDFNSEEINNDNKMNFKLIPKLIPIEDKMNFKIIPKQIQIQEKMNFLSSIKFDQNNIESEKNIKDFELKQSDFIKINSDKGNNNRKCVINNPNQIFRFINNNEKNKEILISKIQKVVDLMHSLLYTKPYHILFGRILIAKQKATIISRRNISESDCFYKGFNID